MNKREQAIATIREALDSCIVAKDRGMAWQHFDGAKVEEAKAALSALSEPGGEAGPVAWIYEDQLHDGYPYHIMFPYSEVRDGVRMFPVYAPLPADRIMEVVEPFMRDDSKYWMEEDRKNLRSRLSELGLK